MHMILYIAMIWWHHYGVTQILIARLFLSQVAFHNKSHCYTRCLGPLRPCKRPTLKLEWCNRPVISSQLAANKQCEIISPTSHYFIVSSQGRGMLHESIFSELHNERVISPSLYAGDYNHPTKLWWCNLFISAKEIMLLTIIILCIQSAAVGIWLLCHWRNSVQVLWEFGWWHLRALNVNTAIQSAVVWYDRAIKEKKQLTRLMKQTRL